MKMLTILIAGMSLSLMVGCSGGGSAGGGEGASSVDVAEPGDQTQQPGNPGSDPNDPGTQPSPAPQPTGPQPGEIVGASDPDPRATYPAQSQPVSFAANPFVEPNEDGLPPIITITQTPNPYIPNTADSIQFWAADDVQGIGLEKIECAVDDGAWQDCGTQLDMTGLAEGVHTVKARATDYDGNQSTEVSYVFYVDTTPPALAINSAPGVATNDPVINFGLSSQDAGSGVANYDCRLNGQTIANCQDALALNNVNEGNQSLEVIAIDNVGNQSTTTTYDFLVDRSAPNINYAAQPPQKVYIEDATTTVNFNVNDTWSPNNISTTCTLNGVAIACANGQNITVPTTTAGNYALVVTATDTVGNQNVSTINWTSYQKTDDRQSIISVNGDSPVDIVFVIDNSGSMNFERSNLAQRIDGMIDRLNGLDWQIGIISTDATNNDNKSDGRLIELIGAPGQYILDSSINTATAQTIFGNTVQNFGGGSGKEEGIYSSVRLIERYLAGEQAHNSLIRDGADLAFVVLSDEDEDSNGANVRVTPQEFVNYVDTTWNGQKDMVWHSIISRPGDQTCLSGEGFYEGIVYDQLSRLTGFGQVGGAIIGSVCAQNYTDQLANIGQSVRDRVNSLDLDCAPYDQTGDGLPDVTVEWRPDASSPYQPFQSAYVVNGSSISFQALLQPGEYRADYKCRIN